MHIGYFHALLLCVLCFVPLTWSRIGYFSSTKVATQCFSVAGLPNLEFECASNEMIMVQEAVQGIGAEMGQCRYKDGDCVETTTAATDAKLREACIGVSRCTIPASVAWMEQCNAYSLYNYVIYTCIPKQEVMNICESSEKALYRKGFISSPSYPSPYPANVVCQCNITTDAEQKILLQFADYNLEWSEDCHNDIVQVTDGTYTMPRCGQLPRNDNITSKTNEVQLLLKTDYSKQYKGFWVHVEALGKLDISCSPLAVPTTTTTTTTTTTPAPTPPPTTDDSSLYDTTGYGKDKGEEWEDRRNTVDGDDGDGYVFGAVDTGYLPQLPDGLVSNGTQDGYTGDGVEGGDDDDDEESTLMRTYLTSLMVARKAFQPALVKKVVIIVCAVIILLFILILIILIIWIRRKRHKEEISKAPTDHYFGKIIHKEDRSPHPSPHHPHTTLHPHPHPITQPHPMQGSPASITSSAHSPDIHRTVED